MSIASWMGGAADTVGRGIVKTGAWASTQLNEAFRELGHLSAKADGAGPSNNLTFTSDLRRARAKAAEYTRVAEARNRRAEALERSGRIGWSPNHEDEIAQRLHMHASMGAVTAEQLAYTDVASRMEYITLAVNPSTIQFEQPKKIVAKDTYGGTRFMHFTGRLGYNNDIMTINLAGSSGDIDLRGLDHDDFAGAAENLEKLLVWVNLYGLTMERVYIPETDETSPHRGENLVTMVFSSSVFPIPFEFVGHFAKVMSWEQKGDKPFSIDYNLQLVVHEVRPPMEEVIASLTTNWRDALEATRKTSITLGR